MTTQHSQPAAALIEKLYTSYDINDPEIAALFKAIELEASDPRDDLMLDIEHKMYGPTSVEIREFIELMSSEAN